MNPAAPGAMAIMPLSTTVKCTTAFVATGRGTRSAIIAWRTGSVLPVTAPPRSEKTISSTIVMPPIIVTMAAPRTKTMLNTSAATNIFRRSIRSASVPPISGSTRIGSDHRAKLSVTRNGDCVRSCAR